MVDCDVEPCTNLAKERITVLLDQPSFLHLQELLKLPGEFLEYIAQHYSRTFVYKAFIGHIKLPPGQGNASSFPKPLSNKTPRLIATIPFYRPVFFQLGDACRAPQPNNPRITTHQENQYSPKAPDRKPHSSKEYHLRTSNASTFNCGSPSQNTYERSESSSR